MQLDADWLMQQGEDADLLQAVGAFFFPKPPRKIAVAVSGGSDSVALLHVLASCAAQTGQPLEAVTLDHGLRPEAATEAEAVADLCATLGVPHSTLRWNGAEAKGNVMAAARQARYGLIAQWAKGRGIDAVALGHTGDDIAETFLMRLSRKAGVDGLAAMSPRFDRNGIEWFRPFLLLGRADLRDYLIRHGIEWIEDPTNDDIAYDRTRARQILHALAPLGIDAEALKCSALALSSASSALDTYASYESEARITKDRGDVLLTLGGRPRLHPEMEDRLILAALKTVGRNPYPPRRDALTKVILAARQSGRATLAGCLITYKDKALRFTREHNAVARTVARVGEVWDGRWIVEGPEDLERQSDFEVRALGEALSECLDWRTVGLPRVSLLSSPAVWDGDTLISAPLAGFNPAFSARIVAEFTASRESH